MELGGIEPAGAVTCQACSQPIAPAYDPLLSVLERPAAARNDMYVTPFRRPRRPFSALWTGAFEAPRSGRSPTRAPAPPEEAATCDHADSVAVKSNVFASREKMPWRPARGTLEYRILGPFELCDGDEPIDVHPPVTCGSVPSAAHALSDGSRAPSIRCSRTPLGTGERRDYRRLRRSPRTRRSGRKLGATVRHRVVLWFVPLAPNRRSLTGAVGTFITATRRVPPVRRGGVGRGGVTRAPVWRRCA
jgi:hypothetical protein